MSRVMTAEMVLQSDVHIESVFAYIAASDSPINPVGKNFLLSSANKFFAASPCVHPGNTSGPSHIGVKTTSGHTKYNSAESSAPLCAFLSSLLEIKRVAKLHVPPL